MAANHSDGSAFSLRDVSAGPVCGMEEQRRWNRLVAGNARFLVLGPGRVPNLASRGLGLSLRRLPGDMRDLHGILFFLRRRWSTGPASEAAATAPPTGARRRSREASGKCFGLFVWVILLEHPDT